MHPPSFAPTFLFVFLLSSSASAVLVNRTIDDAFGDSVTGVQPTYRPELRWQASCQCTLTPDQSKAFSQTWTAANVIPGDSSTTFELLFTGIAINVYFILNVGVPTTGNFLIDGGPTVAYNQTATPGVEAFQYNVLGFSRVGLPNAPHNLTFIASDVKSATWISFDYAIYTADEPVSSTVLTSSTTSSQPSPSTTSSVSKPKSKSSPTGAIAGGIVGALAITALLVVAFIIHRRRKRASPNDNAARQVVDAFTIGAPITHFSTPQPPIFPNPRHSTSFGASGTIPSSKERMISEGRTMTTTTPAITSASSPITPMSSKSRIAGGDRSTRMSASTSRSPLSPATTRSSMQDGQRQELTQRLLAVQQELNGLTSELTGGSRSSATMDVETLSRQIQQQQSQIQLLQSQLRATVLGPADESPPDY